MGLHKHMPNYCANLGYIIEILQDRNMRKNQVAK